MTVLETADLFAGRIAKKTKGLRAKPIISILVDRTVLNKFLVDTLEAREPVSADAVMCIGDHNDAWQQSASGLLKKYSVEGIDADGWMMCVPRPDASVEYFEVTDAMVDQQKGFCYIVGKWGETIDGVPNLQRAVPGDVVARNRGDDSDQWVVNRKVWTNTYSELS